MKKIALIYLGRKGAGAVYAYEMAKGFIANGAELYIFISKNIDNYSKWLELKAKNIESIKTYNNKLNFITNTFAFRLFKSRKLKKKYSCLRVDACYLPMAFEHPWDRYFVRFLGNPQQIATIHDPIAHTSNNIDLLLMNFAKAILNIGVRYKKPDDIIVLSSCFIEVVSKKYKIKKEHVHMIPTGVFDYYNVNTNNLKHSYPKDKTNFLFFGRIDKYKGLDVLAKAFRIVLNNNKNCTLTIVGSGDFAPYQVLYKDLENVNIINRWIEDDEVKSYFDSNSNIILVLPYLDATQSGVLPIAMFNHIPVIVSDAGGLTEQVNDQITGFVSRANDVESLYKTMLFVSSRNNDDIVENAYAYISNLSWDALSKKVLDIVATKKDL